MAEQIMCDNDCRADLLSRMKDENSDQWKEIIQNRRDIKSIITKMNVTLGGIAVAILLLIINMAIGR